MANQLLVLSIDGGGTRGIIPATILNCLFRETGKHPTQIFDLFAGTSTGGILSIGITFGLPTIDLVNLYQMKAQEIFHDSGWDDLRDGFGKNIGADYSTNKFKKILKDIFKDTTLGDIHDKLNGKKYLMVPTFNINPQNDAGKPVNFRPTVFNSSFVKDQNELIVDVALRTSAGPTYFPIYEKQFIDGGVAMNHPAMAAVAFAINNQANGKGNYMKPGGNRKGLGKKSEEVKVLSIGCGTSNKNFIPSSKIKDGDWGNLQWVKYLPDLLTESNVQASEYYVQQVLEEENYKRLQVEFDCDDAPMEIKNKSIGMDVRDPKLLLAMNQYAEVFFEKNKKDILKFLGLESKPILQ